MTAAQIVAALVSKDSSLQEIPKVAGQARGEEPYVAVTPEKLLDAAKFLQTESTLAFDSLSFLTAVDFKTHFEVVYYLVSTAHHHKVVLKVKVDRQRPELPSVTGVWPTADWEEREVYDLMGIRFLGHYNLRRILLPDDWEGHPLRKDYVQKPDRYD